MKELLCSLLRVRKNVQVRHGGGVEGGGGGKVYYGVPPASPRYLSLFLRRSKHKNVALSGRHEREAGKHEPEPWFISRVSLCHARFSCQRGSAGVVEMLPGCC